RAADAGIGAVLLFGLPESKDKRGTAAADPLGPVPSAIRAIRDATDELAIVADVCLCEYTSHGHCGVLREDGAIDNDRTLEILADAARVYAGAGADVVAPSDMMDGRVAAIRSALDSSSHEDTAILAYAAKYASSLYGPFRDAADCAPAFGDRKAYQLDPPNRREALAELACRAGDARWRIEPGPRVPRGARRAPLHREGRRRARLGRGRASLHRPDLLVGPACGRTRASRGGRGDRTPGRARHVIWHALAA